MECHRCEARNPPGHRFCASCGSALRVICPECGFLGEAGDSYCGGCGVSVGFRTVRGLPREVVEQVLLSRKSIEGERKQVTVLFADVKDSLALITGRDVELSQRVLDAAIEAMSGAVHRYRGLVNQVTGDGIMALFGAPLAQEYHAVLACHAAVAIQEAFRLANAEDPPLYGAPVLVRIGLNSGEVVVRAVRNDLTMDYRAIGATTHLASRMEQSAAPGSIRLTSHTFRLAEGFVEVTPLGPLRVKGMREPMPVYELNGVTRTRNRFQAALAAGLDRFVGRQRELQALEAGLEPARAARAHLVVVEGAPGVGKSRLAHEFTCRAAAREWRTLETGAASYATATPYFPLIELVRKWLDVAGSDRPNDVAAKLRRNLASLDLSAALPALSSLLDVQVDDPGWQRLDPAQRRRAVMDAIRTLLLALARVRPTLVVFEDAQWSDWETLAVIDHVASRLDGGRLTLVLTHRPGVERSWERRADIQRIELPPLPEGDVRELLEMLLGDHPSLDTIKRTLVERTQGIPLYLEETIRSLAETGVLEGERGAYALAREQEHFEIPATVQGVLAERIDRLLPEQRGVLEIASVIGNDVPGVLIEALVEQRGEGLAAVLRALEAGDFLYQTRLPPDTAYSFKHSLTREVCYESLLLERRRALHARVVNMVEERHSDRIDEWVSRLADHALRGELWQKAVLYHLRACLRAVAQSANSDAVAIFERGVRAVDGLPPGQQATEVAIDLRLIVQSAFIQLGELERRVTRLREAEELAISIDDPRRLSLCLTFLTIALWTAGRHEEALQAGERGLALARDRGYLRQQQALRFSIGMVHHARGEYKLSVAMHRDLLEELSKEEPRLLGWVAYPTVFLHTFLAAALILTGDHAAVREHVVEGCRIADELGHPYSQVMIYDYRGFLELHRGDPHAAIPHLERAWGICRRYEVLTLRPAIAARLGSAYTHAGRVEDALSILEPTAAPEVYQRGGQYNWMWLFLSLAEAYAKVGRSAEALLYAERACALTASNGERGHHGLALKALGDLRARVSGDAAAAERCYREALEIAATCGMRPLWADAAVGLAEFYRAGDRLDDAFPLLRDAVRSYRELGLEQPLARAAATLEQIARSR